MPQPAPPPRSGENASTPGRPAVHAIPTPAAAPAPTAEFQRAREPTATPLFMPAMPAPDGSIDMPAELRQQFAELESWALGNCTDARNDSFAFWSLKIPAILASATAGIFARFGLTTVGLIIGAIASACVIIDGAYPRGMLRNVHLRAFHDIRNLTASMMSEWRSRTSADGEKVARRIIREAEPERKRIAAYVRDAETALTTKKQ